MCVCISKAKNCMCVFLSKLYILHRCFPVNIATFFKNTYFETHLQKTASRKP